MAWADWTTRVEVGQVVLEPKLDIRGVVIARTAGVVISVDAKKVVADFCGAIKVYKRREWVTWSQDGWYYLRPKRKEIEMSSQKIKRMRQELVIAQADLAEAQRAPWSLLSMNRMMGIERSIRKIKGEIDNERKKERERAKK